MCAIRQRWWWIDLGLWKKKPRALRQTDRQLYHRRPNEFTHRQQIMNLYWKLTLKLLNKHRNDWLFMMEQKKKNRIEEEICRKNSSSVEKWKNGLWNCLIWESGLASNRLVVQIISANKHWKFLHDNFGICNEYSSNSALPSHTTEIRILNKLDYMRTFNNNIKCLI